MSYITLFQFIYELFKGSFMNVLLRALLLQPHVIIGHLWWHNDLPPLFKFDHTGLEVRNDLICWWFSV